MNGFVVSAFLLLVASAPLPAAGAHDRPIDVLTGVGTASTSHARTQSAVARTYYEQGRALAGSAEPVAALRSFREALRRDDRLVAAYLAIAETHLRMGAFDAAASELLTLRNAKLHLEVRESLWQEVIAASIATAATAPTADTPAARLVRAADSLIDHDPDEPHGWLLRAAVARQAGAGLTEIIAFYESALLRDTRRTEAFQPLITAYQAAGWLERADALTGTYLELAPNVAASRYLRAHSYAREGRWNDVATLLSDVERLYSSRSSEVRTDPPYIDNLLALGIVEWRRGEHASAERALRTAFERAPNAVTADALLAFQLYSGAPSKAPDRRTEKAVIGDACVAALHQAELAGPTPTAVLLDTAGALCRDYAGLLGKERVDLRLAWLRGEDVEAAECSDTLRCWGESFVDAKRFTAGQRR